MALNLIKELSKQGHYRTKNKSFLINKVKNFDTEDIIKKNNILFKDPNTFLKLPKETEFDFIINKIPRGPQYDLDDKLIPYTMVGNEKYIKKKKILGLFNSKSFNRDKFKSKSKFSNVSRFNDLKSGYNLITDKEIEEIFDNYKNKINENKNKHKDLIDKNECPKVMKQYIDKNLSLQEKCLKKNNDNAKNTIYAILIPPAPSPVFVTRLHIKIPNKTSEKQIRNNVPPTCLLPLSGVGLP